MLAYNRACRCKPWLLAPQQEIDASVGGPVRPEHDERRLTLTYQGGEKEVNVPIVMVEPADRSQLAPGAHVIEFAATQPDGSLLAERVTVGKNGFAPPP